MGGLDSEYQHIFFDLDHTLWDHDRNSIETLMELFHLYDLDQLGSFDQNQFVQVYKQVNQDLWRRYRMSEVDQAYIRKYRFALVFIALKVAPDRVPFDISRHYLEQSPLKSHVFPHTYELLDYLKTKYTLSIITNGFEDVQHIKMKSSGLDHYFTEVITSERAGCLKPDPNIFDFACQELNTLPDQCIMIGDNLETDILGARNAEIDQIFFNPEQQSHQIEVTFEVQHLKELEAIL